MARCAKIDLVPQSVDLALYAGDGASIRVTVASPQGIPQPVTGTVLAQIKAARTDATALEVFTADLSLAAQGIVRINLTGAQTAALVNGTDFSGVWDVQNTPTGGQPITLVQGKVTCVHDVSH